MIGKCTACGGDIQYTKKIAGSATHCPLCGELIRLPLPPEAVSHRAFRFVGELWLRFWKTPHRNRYLVLVGVLIVIAVAGALGVLGQLIMGVVVFGLGAALIYVLYQITAEKLWLKVMSVIMVAVGVLLAIGGLLDFITISRSKDATIFQQYQATFFGIGGLTSRALDSFCTRSLKLHATLAAHERQRT